MDDLELRISDAVKNDTFYQELLHLCKDAEPEYLRIRDALPEHDQELLDQYISTCEEMEYRRTVLAYAIGTRDGIANGTAVMKID